MKRRALWIVLLLIIVAVAGGVLAWRSILGNKQTPVSIDGQTSQSIERPPVKDAQLVRLVAVGDMLPHETVNLRAKKADGTYDYLQFFSQVKPFFERADLRFCNEESPVASGLPVSGYPTFNAPKEFARDINALGCNLINLANNHANDKHSEGIAGTLDTWNALPNKYAVAGINRSAADQEKVATFTVKGIRFAFLSFNEMNNDTNVPVYGINMLDAALVRRLITKVRPQVDVVLVSTHWGTEDSPGINANQDKWAKAFADSGADVVIGTGPHVIEPVKKLPKAGGGETLVWYSVGNFLSTQLKVEELIGGMAVMDFKKGVNGKVEMISSGFMPTYMHYEWSQAQKTKDDLLARDKLMLYPLDQAADPLKRSLNNTSVEEQTARLTNILNTYTKVEILTSKTY